LNIVYGCCVGSWDKFGRYVWPRVRGRRVITTSGWDAIVPAYNTILDAVSGPPRYPDMLILLHDDLEITDEHAEEKFAAALVDDDVALVGVCGGGGKSLYWWEHEPVGHQLTDVMNIDFGPRTGDVTLIEGSIMVLSAWALSHLRFDVRFRDFHGYDEIGMQARNAGKRVVVADVDTHHHNPMGYKSAESAAACRLANEQYRKKWRL
jgi:hypothetical protein